jgi:hypothetical protein
MRLAYKVLLVTLSLSLLIPLSGAVVYLPQSIGTTAPNPIVDTLTGSIAILGTMVFGKILQWVIRLGQKTKKGVVEGVK